MRKTVYLQSTIIYAEKQEELNNRLCVNCSLYKGFFKDAAHALNLTKSLLKFIYSVIDLLYIYECVCVRLLYTYTSDR